MKKQIIWLALLLCGCGVRKPQAAVPIPFCHAQAVLAVPKGCTARKWGNAVEIDCPGDPKVYFCQPLKEPSPTDPQK